MGTVEKIFLGFTVSTGEGGILCLAQAGFAAAGAFVAGRLATEAHMPLLLAGALGVVAAMVCGIVIGLMGVMLIGQLVFQAAFLGVLHRQLRRLETHSAGLVRL